MALLTFQGSATPTQKSTGKLWQETYPDSGSDEEQIRINHWRSLNSREWPGRVEESEGKTSMNDSADKGTPSPYQPAQKDTFQKKDK